MKMNRNIALSLFIAAASGTALADDITIETSPFVSSRSRSEVQGELAQFKKAGVIPWSITYNPLRLFRASRTRSEVSNEYFASRTTVAALTGEDSGSAYLARIPKVGGSASALAGQSDVAQ